MNYDSFPEARCDRYAVKQDAEAVAASYYEEPHEEYLPRYSEDCSPQTSVLTVHEALPSGVWTLESGL